MGNVNPFASFNCRQQWLLINAHHYMQRCFLAINYFVQHGFVSHTGSWWYPLFTFALHHAFSTLLVRKWYFGNICHNWCNCKIWMTCVEVTGQLVVATCVRLQLQNMQDESRGMTQTCIARSDERSLGAIVHTWSKFVNFLAKFKWEGQMAMQRNNL